MSEKYLRAWLITPQAPAQTPLPYPRDPDSAFIVAIDGGLERCLELGLTPNLLIGDLDSLPDGLLSRLPDGCLKITYPTAKNETDTQLALQYCLDKGFGEIYICNDLGGRFDHAVALVQNLMEAHRAGAQAVLLSNSQIVSIISGSAQFGYPAGTLLSLLSLSEQAVFNASEGLVYPLDNLTLYNWQTRGISNETTASGQKLEITSGLVLAIATFR
jgi:thiamine pyrophosphokinase